MKLSAKFWAGRQLSFRYVRHIRDPPQLLSSGLRGNCLQVFLSTNHNLCWETFKQFTLLCLSAVIAVSVTTATRHPTNTNAKVPTNFFQCAVRMAAIWWVLICVNGSNWQGQLYTEDGTSGFCIHECPSNRIQFSHQWLETLTLV